MSERQKLIDAVQRQIAGLLADLEKRTGCYVDGLQIDNVDITTFDSTAPHYTRRVVIDLRRAPSSHWHM